MERNDFEDFKPGAIKQALEQMFNMMKDELPCGLGSYYNALLKEGFDVDQAFHLTIILQERMFTQLGLTGK